MWKSTQASGQKNMINASGTDQPYIFLALGRRGNFPFFSTHAPGFNFVMGGLAETNSLQSRGTPGVMVQERNTIDTTNLREALVVTGEPVLP
ncbi:hypothetical protein CKAH01_06829 [Colletotrichum kahawae]|uniref:Uncharacterized protein n=1 Tax=Colletotrichum kahawae TaxID=34407 RepID=A0AAD9Y776_COLKA|nr:hypothetical protein CKAH01_06829 [Colletotrichum kahawae]